TYMELEAMRLGRRFVYDIQIDPSIDPETTLVPPLLLQPFVENSIWHGFSRLSEGGKIEIKVRQEDSMVHFIIQDNGIGRTESARREEKNNNNGKISMGMRITQDRIDIINKVKKTKAE